MTKLSSFRRHYITMNFGFLDYLYIHLLWQKVNVVYLFRKRRKLETIELKFCFTSSSTVYYMGKKTIQGKDLLLCWLSSPFISDRRNCSSKRLFQLALWSLFPQESFPDPSRFTRHTPFCSLCHLSHSGSFQLPLPSAPHHTADMQVPHLGSNSRAGSSW